MAHSAQCRTQCTVCTQQRQLNGQGTCNIIGQTNKLGDIAPTKSDFLWFNLVAVRLHTVYQLQCYDNLQTDESAQQENEYNTI